MSCWNLAPLHHMCARDHRPIVTDACHEVMHWLYFLVLNTSIHFPRGMLGILCDPHTDLTSLACLHCPAVSAEQESTLVVTLILIIQCQDIPIPQGRGPLRLSDVYKKIVFRNTYIIDNV